MRMAVFILGLLLGVGLFLGVILDFGSTGESRDAFAGGGIIMGMLWFPAVMVVLRWPRAAAILFAIAGVIGLRIQDTAGSLGIWGGVSLGLAVMAYIGWQDKLRDQNKERSRDELLRQIAANQQSEPPPTP